MAERRLADEALGREVARLDPSFPRTPSIVPGVIARLETDRAARTRPPFPRVAIWSRRRLLALAAVGLLALLALAFGARFVIGAAEVRVQPGVSPTGPPLRPGELGEPASIARVAASVAFPLALPTGPGPDAAYLVPTGSGKAALLAWGAGDRYPALPDTGLGLVLMELRSDVELVLKDVNRFDDLREVRVSGRRAFWIHAPHDLIVRTEGGPRTFAIDANVLIWVRDDVTLRLETSLSLPDAIALAETIG